MGRRNDFGPDDGEYLQISNLARSTSSAVALQCPVPFASNQVLRWLSGSPDRLPRNRDQQKVTR
jgi:hypothetical protein